MNEREVVWLMIGLAIGYLVWHEFDSSCDCKKHRQPRIIDAQPSAPIGTFPPTCTSCGGY